MGSKMRRISKMVLACLLAAAVTVPAAGTAGVQAANAEGENQTQVVSASDPSAGDFSLVYEAEDAKLTGAFVDTKHPGFTGTGFVDFNPNAPGGSIEWSVSVPAEGEYTLEFRYANGSAENRPAEIKVNGAVAAADLAFQPSGDFTVYTVTSTKALLKQGANTVLMTATGSSGGANIDHLRIHNCADSGPPAPHYEPMQPTELGYIVSGVAAENLSNAGILASEESLNEERILTRIEFMAMLNRTFGFSDNDKFPNVEAKQAYWEVPSDAYAAYVLKTAKAAGYITGYADGTIRPDQTLTRQEAANMLVSALKQRIGGDADDYKGLLPAWAAGLAQEADQSRDGGASPGNKFNPGHPVHLSEAVELFGNLTAKLGQPQGGVHVVRAEAVTNSLIAVTLSGAFDDFDYRDIAIAGAKGVWSGLNPQLSDLPVKYAAKGTNKFGDTVVFYQLHEPLAKDASVKPATAQNPALPGSLESAAQQAKIMMSWQMDHGGWYKNSNTTYSRMWDGVEKRSGWIGLNGVELGTIDNDATVKEIRFISQVYRESGEADFKMSVEKGLDFLLQMQYPSGGWPQVYPQRGNEGEAVHYSDYVTFNDGAMIRVMNLFDDILNKKYPFDKAWLDPKYEKQLKQALDLGLDYILKSQIVQNGKLTAWCAQHDPVTYEPRGARSYEHPSISGMESVAIVQYLMSRPNQTEAIKRAVRSALEWFDSVKLEGIRYISGDPNNVYFVSDPGSVTWYRFYDLATNEPIFSGRDGVIKRNILEIEAERRNGYSWAGSYAKQLLQVAKSTGYYPGRVYARVEGTGSADSAGRKLVQGEVRSVSDSTQYAVKQTMTVAQDGTGDFTTVQAAIDAVPADITAKVTIRIKNGVYKEVVKVPSNKSFISLIGESSEGTIITYDNYAGKARPEGGTYGTSGSASVFVDGDDFSAENLTIANAFDEKAVQTTGTQAVALRITGDRGYFKNVRFIGNQDTLYVHSGSQYFKDCYIEGDVDFIFGGARAVFDNCDIRSLDRGSDSNNGYVTAASTQISQDYGLLFVGCRFVSDAKAGTVHLGRPWHPGGDPNAIGSVIIRESDLGMHIKPEGWTDMSGFKASDARFYEYRNAGPGAVVNEFRRQLSDDQAAQATVENVLGGWNPVR